MSSSSPAALRRHDRGKDDDWIRAFLRRVPFGHLATVDDGRPFINSNLFVYEESEHALFLHTARTGRTPSNLGSPCRVAFSAAVMGRLLPADEALEFSAEYAGVVVFGTARTLSDPQDKQLALQRLLDRYAPHLSSGRDYRPITARELERTAVYRVAIDAWSGKMKVAASDHPGGFTFPELRFEDLKREELA